MLSKSLISCLALLLLSACRPDGKPAQESGAETSRLALAGPGPQITTIGFTREDTVLHYTLDIKYPAIREQEVFNQAVRSGMAAAIDEFIRFIREFDTENREMSAEYQVIQNTSLATSIRQMYVWAVPGTSTLQYRFRNVNYNPEAKTLIGLEDLFLQGAAYQGLLKKRLEEKIQARFKIKAEVTDEDLFTFVIGPDYLEFYKVLYPDVMEPEPKAFQLKFSELEGMLK